jgi:opacity protein-like surface antigen
MTMGQQVGVARTLAAAVAALALAAGAAAAQQDTTRAPAGGGRRVVQGMVASSAAFRDSVARALADGPGGGLAYETPVSRAWADRLFAGLTLSVSQPTGQFRRFAGVGVGIAANAQVSADRGGVLGLRVEGGAQNYGRSAGPAQTVQGLLFANQYRQVTSNDIYWGAVGPQLSVPVGPVRPYAFGTVGVANFTTSSRLIGLGIDGRQSQSLEITDLRNFATTRGYGGGVRFRVPRGPQRTAFSVDLGAKAHLIRSAQYLVPGLVSPAQDPALRSIRGQANFVTYHLGISAGGR